MCHRTAMMVQAPIFLPMSKRRKVSSEVCFDGKAYWIIKRKQSHCAKYVCHGTSVYYCEKCSVYIHLECLNKFHQPTIHD